jgi:DNA-binding NarL/FixJ family response regulator
LPAILLTADLLLQSQVAGAADVAGAVVKVARDMQGLREKLAEESPRLVILDLGRADLDLPAIVSETRARSQDVAIVAFGPHVHREQLEAARAAGCDVVISRGQFHSQMAAILSRFAGPGAR